MPPIVLSGPCVVVGRFTPDHFLMVIRQTAMQFILFGKNLKRSILMLWTIVVILIILWLFGFLGGNISPSFPKTGGWIHVLIVIAVILIVLKLLGIVSF